MYSTAVQNMSKGVYPDTTYLGTIVRTGGQPMQHGHLHQSRVLNLASGYGRLMLFKCSKLKTLGTSPETCGTTWSNRVFWTPDDESYELQAEHFIRNTVKMSNRHFQLFSGDFVWGIYSVRRGFDRKIAGI